MNASTYTPEINVYGTPDQATGAFDGGKITEIKPIGFPREGSVVNRVGPLFYWAWASSNAPAIIGMHPHQGFEIVSYVLKGTIGHKDTSGNERSLDVGGLQVMQTASGISHEEQMLDEDGTDFFQIWFEPDLRETTQKPAVYRDFTISDYPVSEGEGYKQFRMIGPEGVTELDTDSVLDKYDVRTSHQALIDVKAGYSIALVLMNGVAEFQTGKKAVRKDFVVINAAENSSIKVKAVEETDLEFMAITVPQNVSYPLYAK